MVGGELLVRDEVYRVVTNDFLAGGQDGWTTSAEGTERWNTYYDMQAGFVEYIEMLEVIDAEDIPMDRIIRLDDVVTILHTNDTHGRWPAQTYRDAPNGMELLQRFLHDLAGCNPTWTMESVIDTSVDAIRAQVGPGRAICGLSGGVDSAVAAALVHRPPVLLLDEPLQNLDEPGRRDVLELLGGHLESGLAVIANPEPLESLDVAGHLDLDR